MEYEVLSPWGEIDTSQPKGLVPRVTDFRGKTIGLFAFFKFYGPAEMQGVESVLKKRFPETKFSHYHQPGQDVNVAKFTAPFPVIDTELLYDKQYKDDFIKWVNSVDAVVSGHGD